MQKKTLPLLITGLILFSSVNGQNEYLKSYNDVFDTLVAYLDNPERASFKNAVFYTEAAYFNDFNFKEEFEGQIKLLSKLASAWIEANRTIDYRYADSLSFIKNFAIFKVLKDTVKIITAEDKEFLTLPFEYDFNDFFGRTNWSSMFVSKLLVKRKGNCHSLPYLYKILADELGATCWLGLAPNHIYIKNRCKKSGWYNTELTSGSFPIDAWITASGYIPLQAIQNGIYMDTLSNRQAIALTVLDLAKGYEFQTRNYEDSFIIKCCDLVLKYHPVNVQAILLKAETLKRNYEAKAKKDKQAAKSIYTEMEQLYTRLFELGYREMPESMYLDWLKSLSTEKAKYENKSFKN